MGQHIVLGNSLSAYVMAKSLQERGYEVVLFSDSFCEDIFPQTVGGIDDRESLLQSSVNISLAVPTVRFTPSRFVQQGFPSSIYAYNDISQKLGFGRQKAPTGKFVKAGSFAEWLKLCYTEKFVKHYMIPHLKKWSGGVSQNLLEYEAQIIPLEESFSRYNKEDLKKAFEGLTVISELPSQIDGATQTVHTADGNTYPYERLLNFTLFNSVKHVWHWTVMFKTNEVRPNKRIMLPPQSDALYYEFAGDVVRLVYTEKPFWLNVSTQNLEGRIETGTINKQSLITFAQEDFPFPLDVVGEAYYTKRLHCPLPLNVYREFVDNYIQSVKRFKIFHFGSLAWHQPMRLEDEIIQVLDWINEL